MKNYSKIISFFLALVMVLSLGGFTAFAGGEEAEITLGKTELLMNGDLELLKFVPEADGYYKFYTVGEFDTYARLLDEDLNELTNSDDPGSDLNFCIREKFEGGKTYYLEVGLYYDGDSYETIELIAEKSPEAVNVTITKEPYKTEVIKDYEYNSAFYDGLEAEIEFSDGTKYSWTYDFFSSEVGDSNVYISEGMESTGEFYMIVMCDEVSDVFYFTTVETPVEYIEYQGSPVKVFENSNGYFDEYYNSFYYYYELPEDALLKVHYKDGTSLSAHPQEVHREGYADVYSDQFTTPWVIGGDDNVVYIDYMGSSTTVPVDVLPNYVESIEVVKGPDKLNYSSYYYPLIDGMEVKLNLKDGTSETLVLTSENIKVRFDFDIYFTFEIGGYPAEIYLDSEDSLYGEPYVISCLDAQCKFKEFTFEEPTKMPESIAVENMSLTAENAVVEVTYDNEEKETFNFDVKDFIDFGDGNVYGVIYTDKGYLGYSVCYEYNENDEIVGYNLWLLKTQFFVEADVELPIEPPVNDEDIKDESTGDQATTDENPVDKNILGDVNGDGKVNIKDATMIQKAAAKITELTEGEKLCADVNADSKVNVKDATAIQKFVAKIETGFLIGLPMA